MNYFRDKISKVRQSVAVAKLRSDLLILAENNHFRTGRLLGV